MSDIYENLGSDYDLMINWRKRLDRDLPLIMRFLDRVSGRNVVDAACGTGKLTIALSEAGYQCIGLDISAAMINIARDHARRSESPPRFLTASLGKLTSAPIRSANAVLILGNSLSYLHNDEQLRQCFHQVRRILADNGKSGLLIQNRYYAPGARTPTRIVTRTESDLVFIREHRFMDADMYEMVLSRESDGEIEQLGVDRLRHWEPELLTCTLKNCGFDTIEIFGSLDGSPFSPEKNGDIICWAEKCNAKGIKEDFL